MTLVQVYSFEFGEISKNTFSYRTPLVVAPLSYEYREIHENTYFEEHLQTAASLEIIL